MTMRDNATTLYSAMLRLAFVLALAVGMTYTATAQTVIEPGPPGTINNAIAGDTTATGERTECHYILRRDAVYIYDSKMRLDGDCDWTIEAEEGDGARPIVKPAALPGGEEAPRPFQVYAPMTVTVRNLWLDGYDTSLPDPGRAADNATLRISADNVRVFVDGVRFDRNRQSALRTDGEHNTFHVTNSEFTNLYNVTRVDQSFVFDTRGNQIDSVSFVNNSIWNLTGQVFRGIDDARIHYLKMDHNTFVNLGGIPEEGGGQGRLDTLRTELPGEQNWAIINLGQTEYAAFRNNLVVNPGFIGTDAADIFVPRFIVNSDSMITEIDSVTFQVVPPAGVDVRNNVVSFDPDMAAAFPDSIRRYTDAEIYDPTLELFIAEKGSGETLLTESVDLNSAPSLSDQFVQYFYEIVGSVREAEPLILPRDTRNLDNPEGTIDLSYSTSSTAYSAGVDGMPVGDLNWFGMAANYEGTADEFAVIGTASETESVPARFVLKGNYPNPFRLRTLVQFDLHAPAEVSIEVFDLLGRRVATVPAQQMQPATGHRARIEAEGLSSGMYLYQVKVQTGESTVVKTGKMLLVK